MICKFCGRENPEATELCKGCGAALDSAPKTATPIAHETRVLNNSNNNDQFIKGCRTLAIVIYVCIGLSILSGVVIALTNIPQNRNQKAYNEDKVEVVEKEKRADIDGYIYAGSDENQIDEGKVYVSGTVEGIGMVRDVGYCLQIKHEDSGEWIVVVKDLNDIVFEQELNSVSRDLSYSTVQVFGNYKPGEEIVSNNGEIFKHVIHMDYLSKVQSDKIMKYYPQDFYNTFDPVGRIKEKMTISITNLTFAAYGGSRTNSLKEGTEVEVFKREDGKYTVHYKQDMKNNKSIDFTKDYICISESNYHIGMFREENKYLDSGIGSYICDYYNGDEFYFTIEIQNPSNIVIVKDASGNVIRTSTTDKEIEDKPE